MMRKNGFSLTEVLLAVMIVAIIGVALASLTTAASRESSLGNSRIILRNNLSAAMRQIREDIQSPHTRKIIRSGGADPRAGEVVPILGIEQGEKTISYCFLAGSVTENVVPNGATTGGAIYRLINGEPCDEEHVKNKSPLLTNVKHISQDAGIHPKYQVPFTVDVGGGATGIRLILEVPNSNPVVNIASEEIFFGPRG